jgi:hypothetical protein
MLLSFSGYDDHINNLLNTVKMKMQLEANMRQAAAGAPMPPAEMPRQPVPSPQPVVPVVDARFDHLADAVRGLGGNADAAAKITIAGMKARGELPAGPINHKAQAILKAADTARAPAADPALPDDPVARAIVLAARKAVNPVQGVKR